VNADDIRVFLAVHQAASIKGAARVLKVEHSTVSRRLAALEESLGARLFERTPEGLVPTDAARAVAPLAEQIERISRELRDAARAASDAPAGPVRIAVSPVVAEQFLMPRVPALLRRFPNTELDVRAGIARASLVGEREADIAIRQHPQGTLPAEPSAIAVKVALLGFAAFASHDYVATHGRPQRTPLNLEGHSVIRTDPWFSGHDWNEKLEAPGSYALSAFPFSTVYAAAIAGLGIAVLPCLGTDTDPRLTRISDVLLSFDMWVATSAQARNNPRIASFKDALIEELRAARDELAGTTG
jgi:DNA-binding transcriptional LysR family regulator